MSHYFQAETWASVPPWFWCLVIFILGTAIGSFLNVCIYRLPRGESLVTPSSHCPHCNYTIPFYLNVPLVTWLALRGKCANCRAPISPRYILVELLTGIAFLACWLYTAPGLPLTALAYCLFVSGLIVATFIDLEHLIIPDEITKGGMVVGFLCSGALPSLHHADSAAVSLWRSALGMIVGGGLIYGVLRLGKLLFGRHKLKLEGETRVIFTETELVFPDKVIPYEEVFSRKSDTITLEATHVELVDRCYPQAKVRLSPEKLFIDDEELDPEKTPHMEVMTQNMTLPREAMGFGDVKFMAAIGAFLGWQSVLFCLMASSVIGALVGIILIVLGKQEWSGRLPYGPYIALGAVLWIFGGWRLFDWWFSRGIG